MTELNSQPPDDDALGCADQLDLVLRDLPGPGRGR